MCLSWGRRGRKVPSQTQRRGCTSPPPCGAKRGAAWPRSGKSLGRKGIPSQLPTVPLGFEQPPPCWLRAFSSRGEGRDWGAGVPSGSRGVGARPGLGQVAPSFTSPSQIPQSMRCGSAPWARPAGPFPLFPRISGGGPGSARGRTFFAKKGKDAAARAAGTSGSDSRHEWVMAPPRPPQ